MKQATCCWSCRHSACVASSAWQFSFGSTNYPLPGEICHILSLNVLPCLFTARSVSLLVHGWVCDLVSWTVFWAAPLAAGSHGAWCSLSFLKSSTSAACLLKLGLFKVLFYLIILNLSFSSLLSFDKAYEGGVWGIQEVTQGHWICYKSSESLPSLISVFLPGVLAVAEGKSSMTTFGGH